uniref:Ion transport domain-containing protein n=1 Tax=Globodera rostochiensis TaxID=31243 RepID=A0A914H0J3_GLORO
MLISSKNSSKKRKRPTTLTSAASHAQQQQSVSMSSSSRWSGHSRGHSGRRKQVRLQRQRCVTADDPSPFGETSCSAEVDDGNYWIGVAPLLDMSGTARVLACKAANISSAMLAHRRKSSAMILGMSTSTGLPSLGAISSAASAAVRHKKSSTTGSSTTSPKWAAKQDVLLHTAGTASSPLPSSPPIAGTDKQQANNRRQTARESMAALAENWGMFSMDPATASVQGEITDDLLCCMGLFEFALKLACLASMVSVCLHTPHTLSQWLSLHYWLLITDVIVTVIFSFDAFLKINSRAALRDRWCQFDLVLLLFHYLSIGVHCIEIFSREWPRIGIHYEGWWGAVRSPRPIVMVKFIRSVIRFKLPRQRIQLIIKRSSQQIQNVTIFFLFFMTLYAIMGVQLFGRMEYHCVLFGTDPRNVTIADLAIPDTMCSPDGHGYECPGNMQCLKLSLRPNQIGFYGMFNDFGFSLFTVYLAASQEGWVFVLYDTLDTFPSYFGFFYFITLIFFLAWLVKNVFIAVITETFAEIRVQFSEMWQSREMAQDEDANQTKLERDDDGDWRLRELDPKLRNFETIEQCRLRRWLSAMVRSTSFQTFMLCLVVFNALINASFVYRHNRSDVRRKRIYHAIEALFTLLFLLEVFLKVAGLGWRPFWRRGQHRFELVLCLGSALNVVPSLYRTNYFTYFQVFRLLRLVKLSPMLEDFVYKIFGPGKKLGGLILFTLTLVVITSAISLQLFCYVPNLDKFRTFPQAFMSMFQIITQEGWTDVVVEILRSTNEHWVPFVAIYFVGYHLFVTLIVLSLFVAVILDNLEMDEELKKVKQLKAREETTSMRTQLPWRLRIFEKFPTRPQMVELRKVSREFPLPKVRDSFTRQFFDTLSSNRYFSSPTAAVARGDKRSSSKSSPASDGVDNDGTKKLLPMLGKRKLPFLLMNNLQVRTRQAGQSTSKHTLGNLVEESNKQRSLLADPSQQQVAGVSGWIRAAISGATRRRREQQHTFRQMQTQQQQQQPNVGEHIKENGDLHPAADTAPKDAAAQQMKAPTDAIDIKALQRKRAQAEFTRNRIEEELRENHPFFDSPLFAVGRDSTLRQWCLRVVEAKYDVTAEEALNGSFRGQSQLGTGRGGQPLQGRRPIVTAHKYKQLRALFGLLTYLDWTMVLITAFSCASMLFESPWPIGGDNLVFNNPYLKACDFVFVLAMTVELALKIVAHGLFFTPNAVVRDVGGFMTLYIYASSCWFLIWMPNHVEQNSMAQLLMIFRAMRPLRIYTLVPNIRRVVVELCKGFREILLVTILLVLFMFMFASFGLQIVGGKLAACNDVTVTNKKNCTGLFEQQLFVTRMEVYGKNDEQLHPKMLVPRVWTNPRNFNFDHIGNAMLALFETLSYKGWNVIRDILWARQGPWAVFFIHVYVFIGCMIGLTLFVDVVIANYMENRGTALLTVDQRRWHDLKARLRMAQPLHVPPRPAESARLRNSLYALSMATLAVPWSVDEEEERRTLLLTFTSFSAICICLFAVEILLKSIAFTPRGYWQSRRNRVDLLITALGLCWVVAQFGISEIALPIVSVPPTEFRRFTYTFGYTVGILRFFTIAGRKSTLKMLMLTVVWSMVRSAFIIAAMFLLALSKHVNFRSGKHALLVLFRSITGEDWNDIMHDCMRSPPHCYWSAGLSYWQTDCGNYFSVLCSFYLIITYIVLNLLVAVIMENFSLFYSSEEDALLSYADIRNYQQVWNMMDVEQKHSIPVRRVKFLLRLLKGRLEVDPNKDRLLFKHMCHEMERLNNGDDVSFHDILSMLSYRSVDIRKSLQLEELVQREELEYLIEEEVAKQTIRSWLESCLRRIKQQQNTAHELLHVSDLFSQIRATNAAATAVASPAAIASPIQLGAVPKSRTDRSGSAAAEMATNYVKQTKPQTPIQQLSLAEVSRKANKRRRSSSIPELVGEAKRFVWGGRLKSLPRGARTRGGVNGGSTTAPISEETARKDMRGSNSSVAAGVSNQRPKQPSVMDRPTIAIVSELSGTMLAMAKQHTAVEKRQSVTIRNHPGIDEKLELSPTSPMGAQHQRLSPTSVYISHQHHQQRGDEDELQRRTPQLEPPNFPGFFAKGPLFASLSAPNRLKSQNLVSVQAVLGWWTDDN